MGAQFRTNVTIFDSDTNRISAHLTQPINLNNSNLLTQTAGNEFIITIQANTLQYQGLRRFAEPFLVTTPSIKVNHSPSAFQQRASFCHSRGIRFEALLGGMGVNLD